MPRELTLALAQMNCLVGDITGNVDKIIELAATARREHKADLVVFPELALTGYPPEDLLMRPEFIERCEAGLERIRRAVGGIAVLVGFPHLSKGELYNAAAVLRDGETLALYHKHLLPNYSVFDEKRYFHAGSRPAVFELGGVQVGLTVCEDIWGPAPMAQTVRAGAQLVVNINASPFHVDKQAEREAVDPRAGVRQPGAGGVREHGRRPGRAGLRRRLAGHGRPRAHHASARRPSRKACTWRVFVTAETVWSRCLARWRRSIRSPACTRRWSPACATTSARTASRAPLSACPAVSIRRSRSPSPPTRWARSACMR